MATITKRKWTNKSGDHEAWVVAWTDASGKRHKKQFDKKRDAEAHRTEVTHQVAVGTFRADAASTTVDDAVTDYLKLLADRRDRGEHVTEHYYRTVEGQLRNYVAPTEEHRAKQPEKTRIIFDGGIGAVRLSQASSKVIGDFRDRLRAAGVGVVTTRRILGSLSRALQNAVGNDLMAINPAANIRVTGKRGEGSKKVVPPSKADLAAVLAEAKGSMAVRMRLSASAGVRASELYALRWKHVAFNAGELTVDGRVDAYKNEDTTKSTAGLRQVPLSTAMLTELRKWKDAAKTSEAEDLVFPNSKGGFLDHKNILKREFRPLLHAAASKAIEKGKKLKAFNWHALRHFAISTWIEAGMQPKTVQTFAGHSSLAVTMSRYGHLFPSDSHRNVMDQISTSIFGDGAQMAHDELETV
ncbi:tyrosine-type recombinase/integrase [Rhizobium leguminosarum]|uniref:tyrosine-type recombinase/integrase n=1 Tax=Rhizobium leguminosarum TaxID=384 RepID=UPI001C90F34A|nr:site-specific integrase [Rhizobium leguminosarum]MBY2913780.1 site-specific integrase [Rhizobium leguminosarum]MBY2969317.1 site-specific integrase [Rhizobium leguminosarum]MBY2976690.1 site-specific integrase [Rhizobium leguminosarum]MBY3005241.1 site-specific integrase [Rhizobium leguminosarum]